MILVTFLKMYERHFLVLFLGKGKREKCVVIQESSTRG